MATVRNQGENGEAVGPWEGLEAVINAVDQHPDPGAQFRACLLFMTSCIKNLTQVEMADALRFAGDHTVQAGTMIRVPR